MAFFHADRTQGQLDLETLGRKSLEARFKVSLASGYCFRDQAQLEPAKQGRESLAGKLAEIVHDAIGVRRTARPLEG